MHIPDRAIALAIEGGWSDDHYDYYAGYEVTVLDPFFWQALGKSLGFDNPRENGTVKVREGTWSREQIGRFKIVLLDDWQNIAHDFYDLILTGGDSKAFWTDLLQTKPIDQ